MTLTAIDVRVVFEIVIEPTLPELATCSKMPGETDRPPPLPNARLTPATPQPPPPPALAGTFPAALAAIPPAPAPPPPAAPQPPAPVEPPLPTPIESVGASPAILPAATPPVEPIPPGAGGYAQSPSAAERKEKARKQASQSAFAIRPAGTGGEEWFYAAVGLATLLALLLSARGLPAGPRPRPALLFDRAATANRRRSRGR